MLQSLFLTLQSTQTRHTFSEETRALKPITPAEALMELPATWMRMVVAGDVDGDGRSEVAVEHNRDNSRTIELVSTTDGRSVRTLWSHVQKPKTAEPWSWDLGDINADGVPDLVLGMPSEDSGSGKASGVVVLVSGATGEEVRRVEGSHEYEGLGAAVVYVGDVDRDFVGDYVVSSREGGPPTLGGGPGFVSARSGRDDRELWRVVGPTAFAEFGSLLRVVGDLDGDGVLDVVAQHAHPQQYVTRLLGGADGTLLRELGPDLGRATPAGDLDDDDVADVAFEVAFDSSGERGWDARALSGRTWQELFTFTQPDIFAVWGVTESVGDVDGDGRDDFAVSESRLNLPPKAFDVSKPEHLDFDSCTFGQLLDLGSMPNTLNSGCLWVVSGRTREPIWVIYGGPNSNLGIGRSVCAVPDVTGDGLPDLIVGGNKASYLFAGPGRTRR